MLPKSSWKKIPPRLEVSLCTIGYTVRCYPGGFCIVYNKVVLQLINSPSLPHGKAWRRQRHLVGWVHRPAQGGSVHMATRTFLQAYGWEKGWRIITGIGANVVISRTQPPGSKDVSIGEVAYGLGDRLLCLGGRSMKPEPTKSACHAENLPLSIRLHRDPERSANRAVAEAFIRFVMSAAGQKLWLWAKGIPDGRSVSTQPFQCSPVII